MEPGQVHPGFGHQSGKSRHKVQRLEDDVGGAVSIGGLQRVTDSAIVRQRQCTYSSVGSIDQFDDSANHRNTEENSRHQRIAGHK